MRIDAAPTQRRATWPRRILLTRIGDGRDRNWVSWYRPTPIFESTPRPPRLASVRLALKTEDCSANAFFPDEFRLAAACDPFRDLETGSESRPCDFMIPFAPRTARGMAPHRLRHPAYRNPEPAPGLTPPFSLASHPGFSPPLVPGEFLLKLRRPQIKHFSTPCAGGSARRQMVSEVSAQPAGCRSVPSSREWIAAAASNAAARNRSTAPTPSRIRVTVNCFRGRRLVVDRSLPSRNWRHSTR